MNWVMIQIGALLLVYRISEYHGLVFRGIRQKSESGSPYLKFICSPESNDTIHYVEFLADKKSTASLVFYDDPGKCEYRHEQTNCDDLCKCNSNGTYYAWTFPMPTTPTVYACLMYTNNQNIPEKAYTIFNGKDFDDDNENSDVPTSTTKDLNKHVGGAVTETPRHFPITGRISIIVVSIVLVLVLLLILWIVLRGKLMTIMQKRKSDQRDLSEDDLPRRHSEKRDTTKPSENVPLLNVPESTDQDVEESIDATSGDSSKDTATTDKLEQEVKNVGYTAKLSTTRTHVRKRSSSTIVEDHLK